MGCILSLASKNPSKPPDRDDGSSVPLLILSSDTKLVNGQAQRQHSNAEATRLDEGIQQTKQIVAGIDELITKTKGEVKELKLQAIEISRRYSNGREFDTDAKTDLARIKFKIQLKDSLRRNLILKERSLDAAVTAAIYRLTNLQVNQQFMDTGISDMIKAPEDKSSNEVAMALGVLRDTMDKLQEADDDVKIDEEAVTDIVSSAVDLNGDELRALVDVWASELQPTAVKQEKSATPKISEDRQERRASRRVDGPAESKVSLRPRRSTTDTKPTEPIKKEDKESSKYDRVREVTE